MAEPSVTRALLPKGYSFVPKGNVFITGNCRRRTKAASRTVYAIFRGKEMKEQIGIGVPTELYLQVQLDEMNTRAERASNVRKRDETIAKEFEEAIVKEFPGIPAGAVPRVLEKALEKGRGKVGRTSTLDISRKAVLAVRAHIRHCHTDYDTLLRGGMSKDEARREVAAKIRDIDQAWRQTGRRATVRGALAKAKSSRGGRNPAKAAQAETPKSRSTAHQELTDPFTCHPDSIIRNAADRSKSDDITPVYSAIHEVNENRRRKILNLIAQIQSYERNSRRFGRSIKDNSSQQCNKNTQKRIARRREAFLLTSKRLNELLEEAGLPRVETSEAMENFAEQMKLITSEPAAVLQVLAPEKTSTYQMRTGPASEKGRAIGRDRELESSNPEDADVQREPQDSTRVIIDLTGDSGDDKLVSVQTKTTRQQQRKKASSRLRMVAGGVALTPPQKSFDASCRN